MKKENNYKAAFEELQQIVNELETGNIGIDELSEKVKRAAFLISFCRKILNATEMDVQQILKELEKPDLTNESAQTSEV